MECSMVHTILRPIYVRQILVDVRKFLSDSTVHIKIVIVVGMVRMNPNLMFTMQNVHVSAHCQKKLRHFSVRSAMEKKYVELALNSIQLIQHFCCSQGRTGFSPL
jgi:hypothetical protein